MLLTLRVLTTAVLSVAAFAAALLAGPSPTPAVAAGGQVAMFEEDAGLLSNPAPTLSTLRELGVGMVRVSMAWNALAPVARGGREPRGFNAADPSAYPASGWTPYDTLVRDAPFYGITVDFSLTGPPPPWATGPGRPRRGSFPAWMPSAAQYGKFVQAVTTRYSGTYTPPDELAPLPRITTWELWNEPNFGPDLTPQATRGSTISVAPMLYRGLVNAAWSALRATRHTNDTIILGNLDARGQSGRPSRFAPDGLPGNFGATKPMQFIRTLYCVDGAYRQLRGRAAAVVGCPTNGAGSRRFRAANPGLFAARGFADHPYPVNLPPALASSTDPDFAEFNALPRFAGALDRMQRIYGSGHRFAIYNNEYGYITNPPNHSAASHFVSPAVAAGYINWAEYLSWRNSRIASTMQFLLRDPNPFHAPEYGGFASGLIFYSGAHKPSYDAYRLPIFLPVSSTRRGRSLEVWGAARPAHGYGNPYVAVQFQRSSRGAFKTIRTIRVADPTGYFDQHIVFPAGGSVRLAWSYPSPPSPSPSSSGQSTTTQTTTTQSSTGYTDPVSGQPVPGSAQPGPMAGQTVYSRTTKISIR